MPLAVFALRINHLSDEMVVFGLLDFVFVDDDAHGGTHIVTFQMIRCKLVVAAICF